MLTAVSRISTNNFWQQASPYVSEIPKAGGNIWKNCSKVNVLPTNDVKGGITCDITLTIRFWEISLAFKKFFKVSLCPFVLVLMLLSTTVNAKD